MRTPLEELAQQIAAGTLKIQVGRVFQMEEIVEAHRTMEENKAGGKIVVLVSRRRAQITPESVQLASARQDVKERESRDHCSCRLSDSYSPRRHWCFEPVESVGLGLRTDM